MSVKDTIDRAYGNIPKEPVLSFDLAWIPTSRGVRYYWIKLLRRFTR